MTLVLLLACLLPLVRHESGRIEDLHLELAWRLSGRLVLGKRLSFGGRLRVSLRALRGVCGAGGEGIFGR